MIIPTIHLTLYSPLVIAMSSLYTLMLIKTCLYDNVEYTHIYNTQHTQTVTLGQRQIMTMYLFLALMMF